MRYLYVESRITSLTWRSQYIQYYSLPELSLFLQKTSFLTCKKCWDLKTAKGFSAGKSLDFLNFLDA